MIKIAPSLLSADFSNLTVALDQSQQGGADQIHIDVMDGHFVPVITIGPLVVRDIRKRTSLSLDVHLMIDNPEQFIPEFVKAGADFITVHIEVCKDIKATIRLIEDLGAKAGITLRPSTPLDSIEGVIEQVALVLVMSVEPGFGGQSFIPESFNRIRQLRKKIDAISSDSKPEISIDGGIKLNNAKAVIDAGVDILVAGSSIFTTADPVAAIRAFKKLDETRGDKR